VSVSGLRWFARLSWTTTFCGLYVTRIFNHSNIYIHGSACTSSCTTYSYPEGKLVIVWSPDIALE